MIPLFWSVFFLSILSWLIYPLALVLIGLFRRPRRWPEPARWPDVSILVAARNEEKHIGRRIENLLAQEYPGRMEILVGSDASEDGTDAVVSSYGSRGVILHRGAERSGKPMLIQQMFPISTGEVLVFTDADTEFSPDTVRQLVVPYCSDPRVGCVDGSRVNSLSGPSCESVYWKYERAVKRACSRLGAVLGATGAVFSLRRSAFLPLTRRRADDFELAVMARVLGFSCVFNDAAVAAEPSPDDERQYRRMVRIVSWMVVSCFLLMGRALSRGRVALFLQLLVHKLLRWMAGLFLVAATATGGILSLSGAGDTYSVLFWTLLAFHAAAAAGFLLRHRLPSKVLSPYYFWLMNTASLEGIFRTLSGNPVETWEKVRAGSGGGSVT
jgi:cellulose synthase/poly-beta-1,6-N-acetylglucosamine synthase-like glycosyltransferase